MTRYTGTAKQAVKIVAAALVCANTALFLVFVDFWGRLTVYSLWFMVYEAYRKYMDDPAAPGARLPAD